MDKKIQPKSIKALILLALFLLLILFVHYYFNQYLSFDTLKHYRHQLLSWTQQHYLMMVLGFIGIYIAAVAVSIPGAVFLTLIGGFLFGIVLGTVYVVTGATIGAVLLFLIVKTVLGSWITQRASGWVARLEQGFQENAFNYLLTLRLIPLFPFWLVNVVPALLNVPLRTFILATVLGIIPGSLVYVMLGNSLGYLFDRNETPNLGIIFTPHILIPILALAILALLPVLYKKWRGRSQ